MIAQITPFKIMKLVSSTSTNRKSRPKRQWKIFNFTQAEYVSLLLSFEPIRVELLSMSWESTFIEISSIPKLV